MFPHELFGQYDLINDAPARYMRMMRTDRWKLVLHLNTPEQNELYDMASDAGESTNLFGRPEHAEVIRELTAKIRTKMQNINDPRIKELP